MSKNKAQRARWVYIYCVDGSKELDILYDPYITATFVLSYTMVDENML